MTGHVASGGFSGAVLRSKKRIGNIVADGKAIAENHLLTSARLLIRLSGNGCRQRESLPTMDGAEAHGGNRTGGSVLLWYIGGLMVYASVVAILIWLLIALATAAASKMVRRG